MSFPRYPEYKDSGVEWLGEVPGHWQVKPLKFIASVQTGIAKGKDNAGKNTIEVPYLRVANVQDGYLALDDVSRIEIPEDLLDRYSLQAGDVLMNEGGDFDKLGRGHIWNGEIEPCIHQNHVFAVRPSKVSSHWLNTITGSGYAQFYFMTHAKQSTNLASISSTNIMELPVVIPPEDEQRAILQFLSTETTKIDNLMAEQEKLIALLKEKRQAVVSHAVIKGLDPTVPMKDSGLEWLGEVPAHWGQPQKLLNVASKEQHSFVNGPFGSDLLSSELVTEGIPVVYIRDIKEKGYTRVSEWCVTPEKSQALKFCNVLPRDIIIAKVGNPPGLAAVYPLGEPEAIVTQDVIRLRVDPKQSRPEYIKWLLNSDYGRALIDDISVESTRTRVGLGEYKQLRFFMPPVPEQNVAADFLERETAALDLLVNEAALVIDLLKERRTALISAAVTGQIYVRGLIKDKQEQAA